MNVIKVLNYYQRKSFGASLYITNFSSLKSFGLPASKNFDSFCKHKCILLESSLEDLSSVFNDKLNKSINLTILSNPSLFGVGLKRYLYKRIRVLKFNRSYRGIRHSQFLPVRYQRSKTNARTQKARR